MDSGCLGNLVALRVPATTGCGTQRTRSILPILYDSDVETSCKFNTFFHQKILIIRDNLQLSKDNPVPNIPPGEVSCESCMTTFESFTGVEIRKLLAKSASAFCELDPVPTELVKSCQDVLLTPVARIINVSLQTGVFPKSMKSARVKPLIKKQDLDCNTLKNYRHVSDLSFISKLIERAAAMRLKTYLSDNNLNEPFQSAYKACHSTETALIRVKNDIMLAVDEGSTKAVILVLLDLSTPFDTVDNSVLFRRLKHAFGLSGEVLNWIKSYLSYRSQVVSIRDAVSEVIYLLFGVPQGSVLGPLVFVMYIRPIGLIARKHGVQFHLYADDTQLYVSLDVNDGTNRKSSLDTLEACISEIRVWMTYNLLKLNDDKTDIIYIASPHFAKSISVPTIKVGHTQIEPSLTVKNLGVIFDQFLKITGMNH